MKSFKLFLNNLKSDESGQDLIEYALVAALVGLGAVTTLKSVTTAIVGLFLKITNALNAAT